MIVVTSSDVRAITDAKDPIIAKGPVYKQQLFDKKATGGVGASMVKFDPGTRLTFHTHSAEQVLYVTGGKGIVATRDEQYILTTGTIVFIPPGEVHWHGASDDSSFSHLAITIGETKAVK